MGNNRRAPLRKRPMFSPLQLAILTGGPLPATFGKFEALHVTDTDAPTDRGYAVTLGWTIRKLWAEYHGRPMTDAEAVAVAGRAKEIDARRSLAQAARDAETRPSRPSNWPADATENFQPIATLTIGDKNDDD